MSWKTVPYLAITGIAVGVFFVTGPLSFLIAFVFMAALSYLVLDYSAWSRKRNKSRNMLNATRVQSSNVTLVKQGEQQ